MIKIAHVPTLEMPYDGSMPYRIYCAICKKNTIAASDRPFPKQLKELGKDTPCSVCVPPDERFKKMLEENEEEVFRVTKAVIDGWEMK